MPSPQSTEFACSRTRLRPTAPKSPAVAPELSATQPCFLLWRYYRSSELRFPASRRRARGGLHALRPAGRGRDRPRAASPARAGGGGRLGDPRDRLRDARLRMVLVHRPPGTARRTRRAAPPSTPGGRVRAAGSPVRAPAAAWAPTRLRAPARRRCGGGNGRTAPCPADRWVHERQRHVHLRRLRGVAAATRRRGVAAGTRLRGVAAATRLRGDGRRRPARAGDPDPCGVPGDRATC